MDKRMKKYRQLSPDRAKVWTEKSPKYRYNHHYSSPPPRHAGKVPVVYYLCRNRQLEHPHFMEVPLSSDDLYLRGATGMGTYGMIFARMMLFTLLMAMSTFSRVQRSLKIRIQGQRALSEPPCPQNQEESSSSSSINDGTTKSLQDNEFPPQLQPPCASPESGVEKVSSWNRPLSLTDYKNEGIANASTQTELQECAVMEKGVSTDDGSLEPHQSQLSEIQDNAERSRNSVSPPPSAAGAASNGIGEKTLESLIRDDVRKLNSFRILEEEGYRFPSRTKLKIINMITQLISCGYVQEKDHSFGLVPTYGPRYSSSKYLSTSVTLGEIDHLPENPQPMGKRVANKKCFSGSLAEKSVVEEVAPTLKRSSSYNSDRSSQHIDSINDKEEESSTNSKCVSLSIEASSLSKQLRCELLRSPLYEKRRISSERGESSRITDPGMPSESKRTTDTHSVRIEESLHQELELLYNPKHRGIKELVIILFYLYQS
ncbi:protein SOSEKI 3-like isoform X3 [Salvia splendens]|uniref:protein SOSEKI 3-like isoform X3 n=2 Tax=Salvia splendens TaxID=180675 RepID=UPI001C259252|nr:protein SOSEKI 3-like isoform X3 [Salvia splendens]